MQELQMLIGHSDELRQFEDLANTGEKTTIWV
jgi:hypothetical protein